MYRWRRTPRDLGMHGYRLHDLRHFHGSAWSSPAVTSSPCSGASATRRWPPTWRA